MTVASSVWEILVGRRHRRANEKHREQVFTKATYLTIFRAFLSSAILLTAVIEQSHVLMLWGLGISMLLDFCDGQIARALERETVVGAQLDGLADRITTALVAGGVVSMDPSAEVVIAATAVWVQFGVVDQFFTNQFLRFGLWSPDHFHELERPWGEHVWRWNWSAAAKLASNSSIVLLALGFWWAALAFSVTLIAIRLPGYRAIKQLADGTGSASVEPRRARSHIRAGDRGLPTGHRVRAPHA